MRILKGEEEKQALKFFDKAAEMAKKSLCHRARCGAIIVKNGVMVAEGFNAPPQNSDERRTCLNEYEIPGGFRHDRTCCIHAEQRAALNAAKQGKDLTGGRVYFVFLDEAGRKIKVSDIKCTICSRVILDAGVSEWAVYAPDGVRIYGVAEFDAFSYGHKTPRKN